MASSVVPCCSFHIYSSPLKQGNSASISTVHFSSSFPHSISDGCNGISLQRPWFSSRTFARFEKFEGDPTQINLQDEDQNDSASDFQAQDQKEEDDRKAVEWTAIPLVAYVKRSSGQSSSACGVVFGCLPSDLQGAVRQSSQASAEFVSSGGMRAIVELLIPQLQFLDDEGAQSELWELSRIFVDTLIEETGCQRVKAIYPDAGAAALLKYRWQDAAFGFSSLSDRKPVQAEDEIIVMVVPDYQMLSYVEKIASSLSDDPPRPLIMWNPRLISEDVGVGINVRNLRRYFLSTFTTVYSMRPLPSGAVFRCYPGMWKVFYDDKDRPNRYLLATEFIGRPNAEDLEIVFGNVESESEQGPSLFSQAASVFSSLNRFMKAISK